LPGIGHSGYLARFDPFELDTRTGELSKDGALVSRLSEQPLLILCSLLDHPGELVLREDLRKRLWPNDTVVEFEHSINAAVKRLRQALGDPAENPRFIETLVRRGYRWKTPVEWVTPEKEMAKRSGLRAGGDLTGKRVCHYRVLEILGGGGMGIVYKAEDIKLGRLVALKFLPDELSDDETSLERFEREARAASALNHPNICIIYAVDEYEGRHFIVMELLEGKTLRDWIAEGRDSRSSAPEPLPIEKWFDIALQLAEGLAAAHEKIQLQQALPCMICSRSFAVDRGIRPLVCPNTPSANCWAAAVMVLMLRTIVPNLRTILPLLVI